MTAASTIIGLTVLGALAQVLAVMLGHPLTKAFPQQCAAAYKGIAGGVALLGASSRRWWAKRPWRTPAAVVEPDSIPSTSEVFEPTIANAPPEPADEKIRRVERELRDHKAETEALPAKILRQVTPSAAVLVLNLVSLACFVTASIIGVTMA